MQEEKGIVLWIVEKKKKRGQKTYKTLKGNQNESKDITHFFQ